MSGDRDIERLLDRWLADGPDEVADRVLDRALEIVERSDQRRAVRTPWRYITMAKPARLAIAAAAVIVILGAGVLVVASRNNAPVTGAPPPTPTPSRTAPTTPSASPAGATRIFWANGAPNTPQGASLGVANIDGTGVNANFITGANEPVGPVVVGDYVYWGNWATGYGRRSGGPTSTARGSTRASSRESRVPAGSPATAPTSTGATTSRSTRSGGRSSTGAG